MRCQDVPHSCTSDSSTWMLFTRTNPHPNCKTWQHLLSSEARLCHGGDVGRHCRGREEVGALGWPAFAILVGTRPSSCSCYHFRLRLASFDTQFEAWDVREKRAHVDQSCKTQSWGWHQKTQLRTPSKLFSHRRCFACSRRRPEWRRPFFETRRLSLFPAPPLLRTDNWPLWHNRRCISSCSDSAQVWMYSMKMIPTCSNFKFQLWNLGTSTNPLIFPWKFAGLEPQPINWFWGSGPEWHHDKVTGKPAR